MYKHADIHVYMYAYVSSSVCNIMQCIGVFFLWREEPIYESHFTTRTPAVPDVFDSGRNGGALRPGRRVCFRCLGPVFI